MITADKMFENLGYKRDYPNEDSETILYVNKKYRTVGSSEGSYDRLLNFREIKAVNKLIEEIENGEII